MRINLEVPYSDKEKAKALGARWDGERKCWYVVDKEDLEPFTAWMKSAHKKPYKPGKDY